jgi:DNA (cytosine-5)-methyltransferase 1
MEPMRATVVDLFCGIGGLSYGFKREGFDVRAGVDSDKSCKFGFETNLETMFLTRDIRDLRASEVARIFAVNKSAYRVLIGCAPCAPFSIYTGRYRKAKRHDRSGKWQLLREFQRLVLATKPHVVSMENVPRLQRHRIFSQFVAGLRENGYSVTHYKVRADRYGVPQRRARLVLFASRFDKIEILPPTHAAEPVTVRDAIGRLPRIKAGTACSRDRLHMSRGLTEKNLRRLRSTGKGGSWRDWSEDLLLACHKKRRGKSFRSVYGRMRWDAPSPVITTQCLGIGNGRFGHPEQNRAISIREAALLQTFPRKFRLVPPRAPISGKALAQQIGNAVPVRLARIIARSIKRHLTSEAVAAKHATVSRRARRRRPDRSKRPVPRAA